MKKYAGICLALIMACGGGPISVGTRPVEVIKSAEFNANGLIGYQPLTFRAEYKRGKEIKGAVCELSGSGYKASFVTPTIIMVPNFGERNQNLVTFCRYESQTVTQVQTSEKRTGLSLSSIATGVGGLAGGALGGLVAGKLTDAVTDQPTSNFGYKDTTIIFEKPDK